MSERTGAWGRAALALAAWLVPACGPGKGASTDGETTTSGSSSGGETGAPTTGAGEWRRICDGSQELRLAARSDGYGTNCDFTCIDSELGTAYVYVRGDCRYWVATRERPEVPEGFRLGNWQVTRTGVLSPALEQELSQALRYERWPALAGTYGSFNSGSTMFTFSDGASTVLCDHACSGLMGGPVELAELPATAQAWWTTLWDAGEPLASASPVRVELFAATIGGDTSLPEQECAREWSFDLDPATVSHGIEDLPDLPPIPSRLVDDPVAAGQLRGFRDAQLAEQPPVVCNAALEGHPYVFYEASDPWTSLRLIFRDAVPFEGPEGGIALPEPAGAPP